MSGAARRRTLTACHRETPMNDLVPALIARGDIGHLALLVWASGASAAAALVFRELAQANRRFDAFVRELARFNRRYLGDDQ